VPAEQIATNLALINWTLLTGLALGTFAVVVLARLATPATRGYLTFTAACAAFFGVLAYLSDAGLPPLTVGSPVPVDPSYDVPRRVALALFAVAAVATAVAIRRGGRAIVPLLVAGTVLGVAVIVLGALTWGGGPLGAIPLGIQLAVLAAATGGVFAAMILGHWYLVIPSMEVSYLQSIVKGHIASMLGRMVVVGAAVWFAIATWQADSGLPSFRHYIMSVDGIFFWQRVLFGLAGPAVLSYLTWETAKIRSTQSATGILYVDFFTVVVGEVLAKYIVLATHVPV